MPEWRETYTRTELLEIIRLICNHAGEGTYRYLIYDVLGFGPGAYNPLYNAGLFGLNNRLVDDGQ